MVNLKMSMLVLSYTSRKNRSVISNCTAKEKPIHCFLLPQRNEDLGNWIKANVSDWQASLIMTKLPNRDGDWILLYGTCYQMMSEKMQIYIWNGILFLCQKIYPLMKLI